MERVRHRQSHAKVFCCVAEVYNLSDISMCLYFSSTLGATLKSGSQEREREASGHFTQLGAPEENS